MIKHISMICALALAALSFTGMATAADSSSPNNSQGKSQSQGQNKTQQLMQTYRSDAQQLKQIHDKTIQHNPQLAKEQKQFEQQVRQAIKKQGYDVQSGQKRMQSMAKKLQSGNLSDKQRKQTMQNFQNERQKMVKARNAALSKPAVQKAGKKLEKDTIDAMNKQNSKTSQLISEMKSVRGQLQQSAQSQKSGS